MRKTALSLVLTSVLGLLLGLAPAAQAGTFQPNKSFLFTGLGAGPQLPVFAEGTASVTLSDIGLGDHQLVVGAGAFITTGRGPGTSFYTGIPVITNIVNTFDTGGGTFSDNFTFANPWNIGATAISGFGGTANPPDVGQNVLSVANGAIQVTIPLTEVGGPPGGMVTVATLGTMITLTVGPFIASESVVMTDVTTNLISIPQRPGTGPGGGVLGVGITLDPQNFAFPPLLVDTETIMTLSTGGGFVSLNGGLPIEVNTVTFRGTESIGSASSDAMVTLVSPVRVNANGIAGKVPAFTATKYVFTPEPGALLLLGAGAAGLLLLGRSRMRK